MVNFENLEKFLHHILRTIFQKNCLSWLPLLFEILDNMLIFVICFPVCDVINFDIKLSFLFKSFSYEPKKSEEKFKYLQNKKIILDETKIIFNHS